MSWDSVSAVELLVQIRMGLSRLSPRLERAAKDGRGVKLSRTETWALNGLLTLLSLALPRTEEED